MTVTIPEIRRKTLLEMFPVLNHPSMSEDDLPPVDDPFFYGWREVEDPTTGTIEWIPLTLEDVLHPQWEDHIMQNQEHYSVCKDLFNGLESHLAHEPQTELLHDTLINWEVKYVQPMCPDLAVIRKVQQPFPKGVFFVKRSGGHVDLVLEVTSPNTRRVDVEGKRPANKVRRYAQVGVPYYIIVDDAKRKNKHPPALIVYQLEVRGKYNQLTPDERGWYWIDIVDLWIGPYQDWVSWYAADGTKIGTYLEVDEARKLAEEQARAEAHARKLAEEQTRAEAHARKLAEEQARAEAQARKLAEEQRKLAEEQRKLAEEQAHAEAHTRKLAEEQRKLAEEQARLAEDRIRELEAMLHAAGLG